MQNRTHFFAMAAQLMRRILVDFARARNSLKRGGGQIQITPTKELKFPLKRNEFSCAGRGFEKSGELKSASKPGGRAPLFRGGLSERRNRRNARNFRSHRPARLERARAWLFRSLGMKAEG